MVDVVPVVAVVVVDVVELVEVVGVDVDVVDTSVSVSSVVPEQPATKKVVSTTLRAVEKAVVRPELSLAFFN